MLTSNLIREKKSLEKLITSGGDERLDIDPESGLNKYNLDVLDHTTIFNRGSCTCNPLNIDSISKFDHPDSIDVQDAFRDIRYRLKKLINYPDEDKFNVFLAPSGSDLTYYPLVFSKMLYPDKKICSLVTCPEELGSGTLKAAGGSFYMERNQFGQKIEKDSLLYAKEPIKLLHFPARNSEGFIIDHRKAILDKIDSVKDYSRIGYLVVGSKSGIENDIQVISEIQEDVLWVVDLCQFRTRKRLINSLLDLNCMVMITGSKFYQSPPFSGALLVPKSLTGQLKKARFDNLEPFRNLFSQNDIPESLPVLRSIFQDYDNRGLALRWESAMYEMEAFDRIAIEDSKYTMEQWNKTMMKAINHSECLFPMPMQEKTNNTIISFRVKKGDQFLGSDDMRKLFKNIVTDSYPELIEHSKVFIGQPVDYGEKSFLRIALGSGDLRKLIANNLDFQNDLQLIKIIEQKVSAFVIQ